jgi:ring-1,2-phenylacetyl-CoA epoxidase subunit PaaC
VSKDTLFGYVLGLADDQLILGHRLSEWSGKAPLLEEELALANIALDLIGQARALYQYAGEIEGAGRDEDMLAFHRDERGYRNLQLVEQPNGDFGQTIARQLFYTAASKAFWLALMASSDAQLAAVAGKAAKESAYHFRHAAEWTVRLGDGTAESALRMQSGLDGLWDYTGELFEPGQDDAKLGDIIVDRAGLKFTWDQEIDAVLARAQLTRPEDSWMARGGREGLHSEHLGHVLAEMQSLQRSYPGLKW